MDNLHHPLIKKYMNNILWVKNDISIECGAFDGITDSCTKFFEESMNWKL
jgi:hypothetical protein